VVLWVNGITEWPYIFAKEHMMATSTNGNDSSSETRFLEPVKKIRLYESIVQQIQSLISSGKLKPGQKLPAERDLAEELEVSRTSIREALRALEMMGYLESHVGVGGGTYIKEITLHNIISPFSHTLVKNDEFIIELLELRMFLEIEVVSLAANRRNEDDLARMQQSIDQMEAEIDRGETGLNGDNAFHKVLADAANNRVLKEFVAMCGDLLEVEREEHLKTKKGESRNALAQHRTIYQAVVEQDEEKAQQVMRKNILNISDVIKSNRKKRHSGDS
jgi:GntR family transcriptional repressor for pyruvate dehydrogenase complex